MYTDSSCKAKAIYKKISDEFILDNKNILVMKNTVMLSL